MNQLSSSQVKVDVDSSGFKGVLVDPGLSIESSNWGIGLFYTGDSVFNDKVIARIDAKAVFDIQNLLGLQDKLRQTDEKLVVVIKETLENCEGENESEIICDFLWSFIVLLENNMGLSVLHDIQYYINILRKTKLDIFDGEGLEDVDYFARTESQKKSKMLEKYSTIRLSLELVEPSLCIPCFEEYFHMCKVIKSRVLEIPHKIDEESEDFTINTTLVPLVDFMNHRGDKNAVFDVDKQTGEIVIRYSHTMKGKQEIFISYNDLISIQQFISTYGFIPHDKVRLFEMKLCDEELQLINRITHNNENYTLIMKWLEILPTIQFIDYEGKICINYNGNIIPMWLIFAENFKYLGWDNVDDSIINDEDLKSIEVSQLISFQEQCCDVIQGVEKIAITPSSFDEVNEDKCVPLFNEFIKMVAKSQLLQLQQQKQPQIKPLHHEYDIYKHDLFTKILQQSDYTLNEDLYVEDWDTTYRFNPITIYRFV